MGSSLNSVAILKAGRRNMSLANWFWNLTHTILLKDLKIEIKNGQV